MGRFSNALKEDVPTLATSGGLAETSNAPTPGRFSESLRNQPSLTNPTGPMPPSFKPSIDGSNMPEIGFIDQIRARLAPDIDTQKKRYAEILGVPENRMGVVDDEIVYWDEKANTYRKVVPDVQGSLLDKFWALGENVGATVPEVAPGVAGAGAGALTGATPASIGVAGAVSGGVEWAQQSLDKLIAGDALEDFDFGDVGVQAALGAVGQGAGTLATRAVTKNPLGVSRYDRNAAIDPELMAKAEALEAEATKRGVDLSIYQKTGIRSLGAKERQLGRFDETADAVDGFRKTQQHEQVPQAIRGEIDAISKTTGETGAGQFRKAAGDIVKAEYDKLSARASKAYEKALDNRPPFWDNKLTGLMDRPSMKEAYKEAQRLAADDGRKLPELFVQNEKGELTLSVKTTPDWRAWDNIKKGLDEVIGSNTNSVTQKLNGKGQAAYNIKRQLLRTLDAANPDYAAARALYGTGRDAADAVLNGGIGVLKNVKGLDRAPMLDRVFNANNISPEEINRMRQAFVSTGKQRDWDSGVATWLSNTMDGAMKRKGNVADAFHTKLWRDPKQRRVLTAALGEGPRLQGMNNLMKVLEAAAKGLPEGSATATDLGAMAGMGVSSAGRVFGKLTSPQTVLNFGDEVVRGVEALRAPQARIKLAEAMLSKNNLKILKRLKMASPKSEQALKASVDLMTKAGILAGASEVTRPADQRAIAELRKPDQVSALP